MKLTLIATALFVSTITLVSGQPAAYGANSPRNAIHWHTDEAQFLLIQDSIKDTKLLTPKERASLIAAIADQLRPNMIELEIKSEKELRNVAAETRIRLIDLNGDGIPEAIAQGGLYAGCGATGNCPVWVFSKSDKGYKLILGGDGWTFQVVTVESTRTNGFYDLILGTHDSASERTLYLYQFRNGKYRQSKCYDANSAIFDATGFHVLKNLIITPCAQ